MQVQNFYRAWIIFLKQAFRDCRIVAPAFIFDILVCASKECLSKFFCGAQDFFVIFGGNDLAKHFHLLFYVKLHHLVLEPFCTGKLRDTRGEPGVQLVFHKCYEFGPHGDVFELLERVLDCGNFDK